jgi:hypothetical protein
MPAYKIILFYVQVAEPTRIFAPKRFSLSITDQIKLLYKAAKQCNPDFRLTILTSADTPLTSLDFDYERVDSEVDTRAMMRERNRMQLEYVERHADEGIPFIFLDTDILLNIDPLVLFSETYDIGLTWRENSDMPINGGIVLARNRNPSATKSFYRQLYQNQIDDPLELAKWFGEQRSMARIVGLTPSQMKQSQVIAIADVVYRLLPCDTHNHTPRYLAVFHRKKILSPLIFHFKGSTSRFMKEFWTCHLERDSDLIAFRHIRLLAIRLRLRIQRIIEKADR